MLVNEDGEHFVAAQDADDFHRVGVVLVDCIHALPDAAPVHEALDQGVVHAAGDTCDALVV